MTLVKRMPYHGGAREYSGFRNVDDGGVYIVTSRTHYPKVCLTLLFLRL
jgi:hypothetical protein